MHCLDVPSEFQRPEHQYPPHAEPPNLEHFCHQFLSDADVDTNRVYLPIYWTDNYVWQAQEKHSRGFRAVPEIQAWLDKHLDSDTQYVTVVQCADGIYERLPSNVHIFSAGGQGDTPIPLLTTPHPRKPVKRNLLASFAGRIECGGPEADVQGRSSWDPDGPGARIRRRMAKVFRGQPDCSVLPPSDSEQFCRLMQRSVFALCPRGYGPTSFRLYEAIGMGAIPVYIFDSPNSFWLPYVDQLDWFDFAVICHADNLGTLPKSLRSQESEWIKNAQDQLARLLPNYFTMSISGLGWQLIRMIGELG